MKEGTYAITNVSQLKENADSLEIYLIENYDIDYEDYFYSVSLNNIKKGTQFNRYYVTEIITHIICPFISDKKSTSYSKKVWAAFHFSEEMGDTYDYDSPEVLAKEKEHIKILQEKKPIKFFRESRYIQYVDLLEEKLNNDMNILKTNVILEADFDPYEAYNGYQYLLISILIFIGGNLFLFIVLLFKDVDEQEIKEKFLFKSMQPGYPSRYNKLHYF